MAVENNKKNNLTIPFFTRAIDEKGNFTSAWMMFLNQLVDRLGGVFGPTITDLKNSSAEINDALTDLTTVVDENKASIEDLGVAGENITNSLAVINQAQTDIQTNLTSLNEQSLNDKNDIASLKTKVNTGETEFGSILVASKILANSTFSITGGQRWASGKNTLASTAVTVPDYYSTSQFSTLVASKIYYVYLDLNSNTFKTVDATTSTSLLTSNNGKLLYVITTNTTEVVSVIDYRSMGYFLKNKTVMAIQALTTGQKTITFTGLGIATINQKPDTPTVTPVGTTYPQFGIVQVVLVCITAEKGYVAGDETIGLTCQSLTTGTSNFAYRRLAANGNIEVYQGAITMVWNPSTFVYEAITFANWAIACKLTMEYT